ncbi:YDG domain-containing protein [Rhizobium sp. C1]|uniref:YDG domain-containing protein n=1 Tax=Rhizobium sp. C1 TaxID=1349799 RepID=UPI003FA75EAE
MTKAGTALSGISANNKTHDGLTRSTLSGAATVGHYANDSVFVAGSGVATFNNKNAGASKAVTSRAIRSPGRMRATTTSSCRPA